MVLNIYRSLFNNRLCDFFRSSHFAQDILKLTSGSTVVAGLGFLLTPINTRLFSPEDYGVMCLIITISNVFSILTSFNLFPVIVMEKHHSIAKMTASLSIVLLPISVLFSCSILAIFSGFFLSLLKAEVIEPYLWIVYLAIFANGLQMIMNSLLQRERRYGLISKSKIASSLVNHAIRLPWGFFNPSFLGLFVAHFVGTWIGLILMLRRAWFIPILKFKHLYRTFKRNFSFMLNQSMVAILSSITLQLPIFWIASACDTVSLGYYSIAVTLVDIPLNLILHSFQSVYYKKVADIVAHQPAQLNKIYWKNALRLSVISLLPLGGIALLSPFIPLLLSEKWAPAITIVQLFTLWRLMRFITAPSHAVLTVLRKNYLLVFLQIYLVPATFFALYLGGNSVNWCIGYIIIFSMPYWFMMMILTHYSIRKMTRCL